MNHDTPPADPPPSADLPPRPPLEVHAEPTRPDPRARVVDAPPAGGTTPPPSVGATAPRNHAWAMLCHLVGLLDFGFHFAFLGLIATLVVWLMRKDVDPEADYHGKEALNFQISLFIWWFVAVLLCCCLIGIPILLVLPIAKIALMLFAAVKAASGERWRYPLTLRLIT